VNPATVASLFVAANGCYTGSTGTLHATLRALVWPCSHKPPCSEAASRPDIVFTAADLAWFRKPLA